MECGEALPSFEAIIRLVVEYAEASGCGNVRTKSDTLISPFDCDTNRELNLTIANRLLRLDVPAIRVASGNVALASLCSSYALRIECDAPPGLSTMLREAIGYNAAGDLVARVRRVTGVVAKCEEECDVLTLMTRIASTFVTAGGTTYVLTVADTTGEVLTCDNADVSDLTLLASSLTEVGACNMWAWKVSTP